MADRVLPRLGSDLPQRAGDELEAERPVVACFRAIPLEEVLVRVGRVELDEPELAAVGNDVLASRSATNVLPVPGGPYRISCFFSSSMSSFVLQPVLGQVSRGGKLGRRRRKLRSPIGSDSAPPARPRTLSEESNAALSSSLQSSRATAASQNAMPWASSRSRISSPAQQAEAQLLHGLNPGGVEGQALVGVSRFAELLDDGSGPARHREPSLPPSPRPRARSERARSDARPGDRPRVRRPNHSGGRPTPDRSRRGPRPCDLPSGGICCGPWACRMGRPAWIREVRTWPG